MHTTPPRTRIYNMVHVHSSRTHSITHTHISYVRNNTCTQHHAHVYIILWAQHIMMHAHTYAPLIHTRAHTYKHTDTHAHTAVHQPHTNSSPHTSCTRTLILFIHMHRSHAQLASHMNAHVYRYNMKIHTLLAHTHTNIRTWYGHP